MTLQSFKSKLVGAKKGHKLLSQKRDALKSRFQRMLKEIIECKMAVGTTLKDAAFSLARTQWATAGDDITASVLEKVKRPSITTKVSSDNVAGVKLPIFKMNHDPTKDLSSTIGVAFGGAVINNCRETYFKAIEALIKLASLQTAFQALDEEIKMTSRRVNALEYVLIPRIEETVAYIIQELDEQMRDDFTCIKKVVEKKRSHKAKQALENKKEAARGLEMQAGARNVESAIEIKKDEGVVF